MQHIKNHPRYQELSSDLATLTGALGKINARISEVEALLCSPHPVDQTALAVAQALQFAETGRMEVSNLPANLQTEHVLLREKVGALNAAIEAKQNELAALRTQLSGEVCAAKAAEHRKIAARAVALLEELDKVMGEEDAFIAAIESAGYNAAFRTYVAWPVVGRIAQRSESMLWYQHRDLSLYAGLQ